MESVVEMPVPVEEPKAVELPKVIELTPEEKLNLSNMERDYLKAQLEMQKQQGIIKDIQRQYQPYFETLVTRHNVDQNKYVFDTNELIFKLKG